MNIHVLVSGHYLEVIFFFFQAEDGIRVRNVTGVQTCALPIFAIVSTSSCYIGAAGSQSRQLMWPAAKPARKPMGMTATSPGPVKTPVIAAASVAAAAVLMTQ